MKKFIASLVVKTFRFDIRRFDLEYKDTPVHTMFANLKFKAWRSSRLALQPAMKVRGEAMFQEIGGDTCSWSAW